MYNKFAQNIEQDNNVGTNKNEKLVQVSKQFPQETQNFTAAHELGHAILHKQTVLHRDRPLDGSSNTPRIREEMQADKFATFFLMPSKLVEDIFFEMFVACGNHIGNRIIAIIISYKIRIICF